MANQLDSCLERIQQIFIKYEFEYRFELIVDLGVKTLFDVTLISLEDMKKIYKFNYIEQRKLTNIQIECSNLLDIDPSSIPVYPSTPIYDTKNQFFSEPDSNTLRTHIDEPESFDAFQSLSTHWSDMQQPFSISTGYATPPMHHSQEMLNLDSNLYPIVRDKNGYLGLGILILNKDYLDLGKKSPRLGVHQDEFILKEIFKDIGLYIDDSLVLIDEQGCNLLKKIEDILDSFNKQLEEMSCLFVAISSHGKEDSISCVDDSQISISNQLLPLFKNDRCKALLGKPKVFIIQTCRGQKYDSEITADHVCKDFSDQNQLRTVSTIETDILIGYASVCAYSALRDVEKGSWYIQAFRKAYFSMKDQNCRDVYRILTLTNNIMVSEFVHESRKQTSQFTSSLTRPFILPKNDYKLNF